MTSMPASRNERAMILAPRSCPSSPGFATTTRILRPATELIAESRLLCGAAAHRTADPRQLDATFATHDHRGRRGAGRSGDGQHAGNREFLPEVVETQNV